MIELCAMVPSSLDGVVGEASHRHTAWVTVERRVQLFLQRGLTNIESAIRWALVKSHLDQSVRRILKRKR